MDPNFDVEYLDEATQFILSLPVKVREKVLYNITKSRYVIDKNLFSKLGDTEIWEFRTLYSGNIYRLFAFWNKEKNAFVVATHGIQKKTQKTPRKEIEKAQNIMKEYYKQIKTEEEK